MKKIKIILIILITFFAVSPFISDNLNSNLIDVEEKKQDNNKNSNSIKNRVENLKTSKSWDNFTFIHITGANWSIAANYDWVNGSGKLNDPYVLENITIDAGDSAGGILIENSNAYFRIENCTVKNSSTAGIKLFNVTNGNLINNTVNNNYFGINLEESNNNSISLNTANYNEYAGIFLDENNSTSISLNTANYNEYAGIVAVKSNNNSISLNTANYNSQWGIHVIYLNCNNNISQNTANYNSDGIALWGACNYNVVSGNTANNNSNDGIDVFYNCINNTVSGNIANYNVYSIHLINSRNNTITGNKLVGNVFNVTEDDYCEGNIIENNDCYTSILPAGINEFVIEPYNIDDIDVNITIALEDDTKAFFSAFNENSLDEPLDNGLIFVNLWLNDTDNLNQNLDAPINITLKYDVSKYKEIEAFWFDEDGAWKRIPFTDLGNGFIVISVNYTSIFALTEKIHLYIRDGDDGGDNINLFLIIIIAFFICIVSSIAASSTYYYKKRSKTRAKPTKKETLAKKPLVKSYDENIVKSRNLKDYVETENLLRVLKEKNALEQPALFHDLKFNAVSHGFWEKLDKLELNEEDFNDFLNEMFSLTPEERLRIIDGMLKL